MSANASIREIFDDISLSVISFLENHEGVASVDFVERRGITLAEITAWEQDHAPYRLPNDYKAFLLISNFAPLDIRYVINSSSALLSTAS